MTAYQRWAIEFYTDARGRSPVIVFIQRLTAKEQAKVLRMLELLQEFGPRLRLPHARSINGLWELRAGPVRLFYMLHAGQKFVILHGYYKKSQKAPKREIETAKRRWADFVERNSNGC